MPRPPFILSREAERAAIDRVIRDPAKRLLLYNMVDAVLRVREAGAVSNAELAPILAGFEATDEAVWSRAAGWLAKLHAFAPDLSAAVLDKLSRHRSAVVRFKVCVSIDRFPPDFAVAHLRRFLRDRSARVRGAVASVAVKAGYRELIPDFETLLTDQGDSEWHEDLREAIALLLGETFRRRDAQVRKLADGSIEYVSNEDSGSKVTGHPKH